MTPFAHPSPTPCFHKISIALLLLAGLFSWTPLVAQGFEFNSVPYPIPAGGAFDDGVPLGFSLLQNHMHYPPGRTNNQWDTRDMNGDHLPDLVVTSHGDQGYGLVLGSVKHPHWEVYLGNGGGFDSIPIEWTVPRGGFFMSNRGLGFHCFRSSYAAQTGALGSQIWTTRDMNLDAKPDLVVMSEKINTEEATYIYHNGNQAYWKVYLNTGTGFALSPVQWNVPEGGWGDSGFYTEFMSPFYSGFAGNFHSWELRDMDGDIDPDLVVTSNKGIGFDLGVMPHWNVYRNIGTGFEMIPIRWELPAGGRTNANGTFVGFMQTYDYNATIHPTSGMNWDLQDLDGDLRPDLVITAEQDTSPTNFAPTYGLPNSPHWRIFRNNGHGFDSNFVAWPLPAGGTVTNGLLSGFIATSGGSNAIADVGTQTWTLVDIDGDNRKDLIITAEVQAQGFSAYSPDNNPYWKVFLNNGNGFNPNALHWPIPYGGKRVNGILQGFSYTSSWAGFTQSLGSRSWDLIDLNGDARPDFVLLATKIQDGTDGIVFGLDSNFTHWKVHWNTAAPLAIPPVAAELEFTIAPNPASDIVRIDAVESAGIVTVLDLHGKALAQMEVLRGRSLEFSVRDWTAGIYFVEFQTRKGRISKKLVVQ